MADGQKRVAIIGGGVAGLSAAWHLAKRGAAATVYEALDRFGGNARTVNVEWRDGAGAKITRWVDLGVNDFNEGTFRHLVEVFDELRVPRARVDDRACFYTRDGRVQYTMEQTPQHIASDYLRFQREACEIFHGKYAGYTVGQWLAAKRAEGRPYSAQFVDENIYPRMSGMFFVSDEGPWSMPLWSVMNYYKLQEGFCTDTPGAFGFTAAGAPPERMYFVGGSGHWIDLLVGALRTRGVALHAARLARIAPRPAERSVYVHTNDGGRERYDAVVLAMHANAVRHAWEAPDARVAAVLDRFQYSKPATAVVHCDERVLAPDKNLWRAYNIPIREGTPTPWLYSITYVENMHQNDAQNPKWRDRAVPPFFTTINPQIEIREDKILHAPGRPDERAVWQFFHNVMTQRSLDAQQDLVPLQGTQGVYFAGGHTYGVGIHEHAWLSGQVAVMKLFGEDTREYDFDPRGQRAPATPPWAARLLRC